MSPRAQLNTVDHDNDSIISEGDKAGLEPERDNDEFKQMDSIEQRYDSIMRVDKAPLPNINQANHFASIEEKFNEAMQDKPLFELPKDEPNDILIQKENYIPVL